MTDVSDILRTTRFFTICACNYLAQAAALGRSISAVYPNARLTVFLLDDLGEEVAGIEHLHIVAANSMMTVDEWDHRRCFYEVMELAAF
jgi:hypothetical protein